MPPGAAFDGFDRYPVANLTLGASRRLPGALGAEQWQQAVELGWSHVAGLPDPGRLRYGRSGDYGVGAVNGIPCSDTTAAQKSCAHDGYISADAWGYRLRLAAAYPGAWLGATVTPSLAFFHDVRGYSYDGTLLQGRKTLKPGLRLDWGRDYFAELQYTRLFSARYNLLSDRSQVTLVAGASF